VSTSETDGQCCRSAVTQRAMTAEWHCDPSQRTQSLSSFESLKHVSWWLLHHGVWHPPQELERIWGAHQEKARDHTLWIVGTDRPWVRILRKRHRLELGDTNG
jgi:hypothetical protein